MCKVYTGYHGTSEIEYGLCACTVDNPLAKARGLFLRTGAQTKLYLSLMLQLNKVNASDTKAPVFGLHWSIFNGSVESQIHNKRDDFDFEIHAVYFPVTGIDVLHSTSYEIYISQLIRFSRVSNHMTDFNTRKQNFGYLTYLTGLSAS